MPRLQAVLQARERGADLADDGSQRAFDACRVVAGHRHHENRPCGRRCIGWRCDRVGLSEPAASQLSGRLLRHDCPAENVGREGQRGTEAQIGVTAREPGLRAGGQQYDRRLRLEGSRGDSQRSDKACRRENDQRNCQLHASSQDRNYLIETHLSYPLVMAPASLIEELSCQRASQIAYSYYDRGAGPTW